jgi:hypothetical protein
MSPNPALLHATTARLAASVESLYTAFAGALRHAHMEACAHCVNTEELAALHQVPLRALSAEQLGRYAFKAMTTWGDAADYKHFLPRILELSASEEGDGWPGLDVDLVSRKVLAAGGASWPGPEREALRAYALARWGATLASSPDVREAAVELPGLSRLVQEVAPFLACWEEAPSLESALQLADTLIRFWQAVRRGDAPPGWEKEPELGQQVRHWVLAPERHAQLERAWAREPEQRGAETLAGGLEAWRCLTATSRPVR